MKKYMLLSISMFSLIGCGGEDVNENGGAGSGPGQEVPTSNCTQFVRDGIAYPVITESNQQGSSVIEFTGYIESEYSDTLTLHNSCGSAYKHMDMNGNIWNQAWLIDGEYYRSNDLPSHVSYQLKDGVFSVSQERWLKGQQFMTRSSGKANRISYRYENSVSTVRKEEWVTSGNISLLSGSGRVEYHRPRKQGPAIKDYTYYVVDSDGSSIHYDWIESSVHLKNKAIHPSRNLDICRYYIDGITEYDEGCHNEDELDKRYGFK